MPVKPRTFVWKYERFPEYHPWYGFCYIMIESELLVQCIWSFMQADRKQSYKAIHRVSGGLH